MFPLSVAQKNAIGGKDLARSYFEWFVRTAAERESRFRATFGVGAFADNIHEAAELFESRVKKDSYWIGDTAGLSDAGQRFVRDFGTAYGVGLIEASAGKLAWEFYDTDVEIDVDRWRTVLRGFGKSRLGIYAPIELMYAQARIMREGNDVGRPERIMKYMFQQAHGL